MRDLKVTGLTLLTCIEKYWEFVREMRTDPRVVRGFIQQDYITGEQQKRYMQLHWQEYFVALLDSKPVGFVGSVDGDIRVCTHPDHQCRGIGRFMIQELMRRYPASSAKIKIGNVASQHLFTSCGFTAMDRHSVTTATIEPISGIILNHSKHVQ